MSDSVLNQPLIPVRMVNEYQYCPRLAYLEWVDGEWAESAETVEGKHRHTRVDGGSGQLPPGKQKSDEENTDEEETIESRSVTLSSPSLGIIAKVDLVESDGTNATPVDYKRGKRPHIPSGAYDPERVQLCAQGLLLREHGYDCDYGILYYCESKERVRIDFDQELLDKTLGSIEGLRGFDSASIPPEPLQDSPKCPRCSLVEICLPDEVNRLRGGTDAPRSLAVSQTEALPLYVQAYRGRISKKGETLEIAIDDKKVLTARLIDVSQLVVMGSAYLSTPALHELMRRGIPVSWHSYGGWFVGHTIGIGHKNVELRMAQYRAAFDPQRCLEVAKGVVSDKIQNSRTILRRNWKGESAPKEVLTRLKHLREQVGKATQLDQLLGIEGAAAATYFGAFNGMLKKTNVAEGFEFDKRNRRPPTDPMNAMLSFAYAMLVRTWTVTLSAVGLDPYCGFYHQPRYGRPALALDLMEIFRPLIADSAVITAVNNGEVSKSDFVSAGAGTALKPDGRKAFIQTFERRLDQEITHPVFGYKVEYRRLFEVHARLLARYLTDEIPNMPSFTTR